MHEHIHPLQLLPTSRTVAATSHASVESYAWVPNLMPFVVTRSSDAHLFSRDAVSLYLGAIHCSPTTRGVIVEKSGDLKCTEFTTKEPRSHIGSAVAANWIGRPMSHIIGAS
jgi:hypothetical protein